MGQAGGTRHEREKKDEKGGGPTEVLLLRLTVVESLRAYACTTERHCSSTYIHSSTGQISRKTTKAKTKHCVRRLGDAKKHSPLLHYEEVNAQ